MKNQELGRRGELLAADRLKSEGFNILHQNWRHKKLEVDIIAEKKGRLHFIEVKTRSSAVFGLPEQNVTTSKMKALQQAAEAYLQESKEYPQIQFDIISVIINRNDTPVFFFIEDVYDWD